MALTQGLVVEESFEDSPPEALVLEETMAEFSTEVSPVLFVLTVFSPLLDSGVLDITGDWQALEPVSNSA